MSDNQPIKSASEVVLDFFKAHDARLAAERNRISRGSKGYRRNVDIFREQIQRECTPLFLQDPLPFDPRHKLDQARAELEKQFGQFRKEFAKVDQENVKLEVCSVGREAILLPDVLFVQEVRSREWPSWAKLGITMVVVACLVVLARKH